MDCTHWNMAESSIPIRVGRFRKRDVGAVGCVCAGLFCKLVRGFDSLGTLRRVGYTPCDVLLTPHVTIRGRGSKRESVCGSTREGE